MRNATIVKAMPNGNENAAVVVVECPYCTRQHTHGIPGKDLDRDLLGTWGGRVAHCVTETTEGYILADPWDLVQIARMSGEAVSKVAQA